MKDEKIRLLNQNRGTLSFVQGSKAKLKPNEQKIRGLKKGQWNRSAIKWRSVIFVERSIEKIVCIWKLCILSVITSNTSTPNVPGNQQAISQFHPHQVLSHMKEASLILQKYRLTFQNKNKNKSSNKIMLCHITS